METGPRPLRDPTRVAPPTVGQLPMPQRPYKSTARRSARQLRDPGPSGFRSWTAADLRLRYEGTVFFVASVAWVLLLYGRALGAPFVYDDLAQIVHNPNLSPWHVFAQRFLAAPVAFTNDLGGAAGSTYRPLYWLSILLDAKLWGVRPMGFHATNLLLHVANGWLGFRLLRRVHVALDVAVVASMVWLGLPIGSEVVAWVSGRSYSLCVLFLLLGLSAAEAYRENGARRQVACYGAASLASLLSNETGLLLLPLTLLLYTFGRRCGWRRLSPLFAASLLADAICVLLRRWAGVPTAGPLAWTWGFGLAFWKYVGWMALPVRMSVERSTSTPGHLPATGAFVAAGGLLALVAACIPLRERISGASAGMAWTTLCLLPFCGFAAIYQGMAERFTYAASAGFAFAIVSFAFGFRGPVKGLLLGCVAVWAMWGGWRLRERVADWSDPVALYAHSLDANPHSPSLYFNLAFSRRQSGDLQGAEEAYLQTIELQRNYPHALTSLGETYLQMGRMDDAERQFVRAIAIFPNDSSAYTNLGVIFSRRQLPRDAARMFSKAIEDNATDPTPYFDLAVILQQAGHGEMALPLYRKVLELQPNDPETLANMRRIRDVP